MAVPAAGATTRRRPWPRAAAWIIAVLPFVLIAVWRAGEGPGLEADDYGQYLMHARALVEGRSYTDIGYLYSRYAHWIGPVAAAPGLPLMLAVIYGVVGADPAVMKLVLTCFAIVFLLLAGLYFARHDDRRLGLGVTLLIGLPPAIVQGSAQLLTDLPFAAFIWGVIYLADLPGRFDARRIAAITVLGGCAILFRPAGIVLLPALLLFTLVRYPQHRLRPVVPVLIWIGCMLIVGALIDLNSTTVLRPQRFLSWISMTKFGWVNVPDYSVALLESHLHPLPWNRANDIFHVYTAILMIIGLALWLPRALLRFGTIFGVAYLLVLLITPATQPRYMWPLFPFAVFGLLNGVRAVAAGLRMAPSRQAAVALGFAVVLAVPAIAAGLTRARALHPVEVREVRELMVYMTGVSKREPVRVMFTKPRSFTWATGIPAMGPIIAAPDCILEEFLRQRITHVILGNADAGADRGSTRRRALARSRPDLFFLEYSNPRFVVYRFRWPAGQPAPPCTDKRRTSKTPRSASF